MGERNFGDRRILSTKEEFLGLTRSSVEPNYGEMEYALNGGGYTRSDNNLRAGVR
jgi:hypothetical protein